MSKKSPQLRFEGFTDDWEQRKLGKVFKTYSGMTPLRSDISNFKNPEVPWIKTTDLKNSDITSNDEKISAKAANKLKVLPVNTVLIAMYGGFNQIGRTGLLTYPATINQALTALEPNDSISPYFLLTELNYRVNDWKKFAASSRKDPNITKRDIDNFMINFPTQQEQQKVGSFFQQLDNTITLHQRKLDLLKEQKKGYLQKMFPKNGAKVPELRFAGFADDWEERKLIDVKDNEDRYSYTGGPFGSDLKSSDYTEIGVRIIQLQNIGDGKFVNDYKIYTSEEKARSLNSNLIYPGEIIIAKMADPLARATILPKIEPKYLMASDGIRLKINTDYFDNYYILTLINSDVFRKEALNNSTGTTRKRIGLVTLGNLPMMIPSFEEQQKIGSLFKQLDDTIALHQRKLDLLKEQKKGFLQKMFV